MKLSASPITLQVKQIGASCVIRICEDLADFFMSSVCEQAVLFLPCLLLPVLPVFRQTKTDVCSQLTDCSLNCSETDRPTDRPTGPRSPRELREGPSGRDLSIGDRERQL